jgi:hypothetical protein
MSITASPAASLPLRDLPYLRLSPRARLINPRRQHRAIGAPGDRNHNALIMIAAADTGDGCLRASCSRERCFWRPEIAPWVLGLESLDPGGHPGRSYIHPWMSSFISDQAPALGSCMRAALRVAGAVNNNNRRVRTPFAALGCRLALTEPHSTRPSAVADPLSCSRR